MGQREILMTFSLCRAPTWKGVVSAATTIGLLLLVGGCSFQHYPYNTASIGGSAGADCGGDAGDHCENSTHSTGGASGSTGGASASFSGMACPGDAGTICEPACTVQANVDGGYPSSLVAHWTFDGDGGAWLESVQGAHTYPLTLSPGAQDADMRYSKARINGEGNSLRLNGNQYATYAGTIIDPLFPGSRPELVTTADSGFTISAYISMESLQLDDAGAASTHVMPIVSTMTSDSCGYQLDLRWNDSDLQPTLAFSYGYKADSDAADTCQVNTLQHPLDLSPVPALYGWGMGRWHQVAGTYVRSGSKGSATLKLYWDGQRVANDIGQAAEATPPIGYTDYKLYVGTSGDKSQWFQGYIDEIALFSQPLSDPELANFLTQSTTRPGPSQCRWHARDLWDKYAPDASTASWQSDSNIEQAHVLVDDNNFGAGLLQASLVPAKDLRLYSKAYLDATLQKDKAFEFELYNGRDFCQWLILGVDGRHTYPIDLSAPDACYTSSCAFKLNGVDSVQIASEWIAPVIAAATPNNPIRNPGADNITVYSVGFEYATNPTADWSNYGGAIGPNGWCWRTLAFDLASTGVWSSDPSVGSVSANLSGLLASSTRVTADFGNQPYRLPKNACVLVDADSNWDNRQSDETLAFVINDLAGSWGSWDMVLPLSGSPAPCMMQLTQAGRYYSSTNHAKPFDTFPDSIDLNQITYLGIQKPYGYDTSLKGPVEVTIRGMTIYPDDGNDCATYGVTTSCRPK